MITAFHQIEVVMLALVITTLCCGSIIIFAMQTKYDITRYVSRRRFRFNSFGSLRTSVRLLLTSLCPFLTSLRPNWTSKDRFLWTSLACPGPV